MPLAPSTRLGPYHILAPIGAGAMGEVYRARDPRLDREVALKVLSGAGAGDPNLKKRFEEEARAASALNHPNILTVHDVGAEDGTSYIVSELIYGEPLRKWIRRGPVALPKLLDIATQIADGLAAAHQAGVVHRDLKPENIMLTGEGRVKLLDFGLAKPPDAHGIDPDRTLDRPADDGVIVGTVSYMSPEQARGGRVDFRSDQFSFGSILYEMLTGERPFARESAIQTLLAITTEEPPLPAHAPAPLRWLVQRCLAKDPNQRYGATIDLYHDLLEIRDHLTEALPLKVVRPAINDRLAGVEIAVLVIAALLVGFLAAHSMRGRADRTLDAMQFIPVAAGGGLEAFPAWSPDGKALAYSAESRGMFQIFTRPANGGPASQITEAAGHAVFPFWSPDGKRIYFISAESGAQPMLWRVGAAGGKPEAVAGNVAQAAISPDGQALALLRREGAGYALWLSRPPGAPAERYTRFKPVAQWPWLAFSPGGRELGVWGSGANGESELWLAPMDGGDPRRVLRDAAVPAAQRFSWMPNGRIVFSSGNHLRAAQASGESGRAITAGTGMELFPAASPDGERIAFTSVRFAYEQVRVPVEGAGGSGQAAGFARVPHGGQSASVHGANIVLRDRESGWERALVTPADFEGQTWWIGDLEFSPAGDRVAYTRSGTDGTAVWVSPISGGVPVKVAGKGREPTFSPDGATLAYSHTGVGIAKGEGATALTRDGGRSPKWSPRGGQIAYIAEGGLRLVDAAGARVRDLASGSYLAIDWTPTGKLLYALRVKADMEVVRISPESGLLETVASLGPQPAAFLLGLAAGRQPVRRFALAQDGRSLEISMLRPEADLWTLSGFEERNRVLDRFLNR
jgi:Tol biopolymer transport system component